MDPLIIVVNNNDGAADWEGVYVNGKLVIEDHSLSIKDFIRAIGINATVMTVRDELLEEWGGRLPTDYGNITQFDINRTWMPSDEKS